MAAIGTEERGTRRGAGQPPGQRGGEPWLAHGSAAERRLLALVLSCLKPRPRKGRLGLWRGVCFPLGCCETARICSDLSGWARCAAPKVREQRLGAAPRGQGYGPTERPGGHEPMGEPGGVSCTWQCPPRAAPGGGQRGETEAQPKIKAAQTCLDNPTTVFCFFF